MSTQNEYKLGPGFGAFRYWCPRCRVNHTEMNQCGMQKMLEAWQ